MLHRLPSELLLDIIEHCDRCALKNLSLVFRRLRNPAQSLLYETLGLGLWTVYMGGTHSVSKRVKGILASPRLLSYIHSLRIYGKDFNNADLVDELFLSLNKMSSLKSISFKLLFRPSSLGSLCNLLSVQPLNICFEDCDYPQNYVVPVARLKILRLDWSRHPQTQGDFFDQLLERASQDISSLDTGMVTSPMRPVAMPQLTSLALSDSALSGDNLASFLKANPQLLDLTISEMQLEAQSLLTTVPRLQTINAPLRLLSHFVPGRPIKRVNVYRFSTSLQAVVEALDVLSQSITPINDLRLVVLDYEIEDLPEIMKAVIRLVPRLEHLTIEFVADALPTVLEYIIKLTLLRQLTLTARLNRAGADTKISNLHFAFGTLFKACQDLKVIHWSKETRYISHKFVAIKTGWSTDGQGGEWITRQE